MHAYLLIGPNEKSIQEEVDKLRQKLNSKLLEFSIKSIDQVRELGKFSRLSLTKPTTILIKDIDQASNEALNAFLKDLEEPQENLSFFLTASSIYKVVPTISSRCQIINTGGVDVQEKEIKNAAEFLKMDSVRRIKKLDEIREREEAVLYLQEFLNGCHTLIHQKESDKKVLLKALTLAQKTLTALKANGNVSLQLTNFAINA